MYQKEICYLVNLNNFVIYIFSEDHTKKIIETKSEVNPIGLLQEMCMARHCELPNYDFLKDELNETHNPWYSVTCCLKNHKTMGKKFIKLHLATTS